MTSISGITTLPPIAAVNAGASTGGGIIDTIKSFIPGMGHPAAAGGATPTQTKGDGSVGLFDGVGLKALIGGAAGAAIGFIPIIPGGPILGGIVGALGGAALGVFSNWRKMQAIKADNQATIAAMGVQTSDPVVQQMMATGDVSQLAAYAQQQATVQQRGAVAQGSGVTTQTTPTKTTSSTPTQNIQQVTDPATGKTELIDVTTGTLIKGDAPSTAQVGAAIDPSRGADPGARPTAGGGSSVAEQQLVIGQLQAKIDEIKAFLAHEAKSDVENKKRQAQLDAATAKSHAEEAADSAAAQHTTELAA
ncbi:MAG: hypothetical protein H7287_10085 [Thermoleophilia bacterium]|nr:hypothetical protein [Thermoleophilia bacterium]